MTRLRRLLLIVAVVAVLLVSTASVATAASGLCRFITDYSGNIVRVECDTIG
jgi:conjugal transfer/entry exclusion protein